MRQKRSSDENIFFFLKELRDLIFDDLRIFYLT